MNDFSRLPVDWERELTPLMGEEDLGQLYSFIDECYERYPGLVNPARSNVFRAFHSTPYEKVRVVLIGQDPYPGKDVADGLAFSTSDDNPTPASLKNIIAEWIREFGEVGRPTNSLSYIADQGVFLFNTALIGCEGIPMFFAREKLIERFSRAVVTALSRRSKSAVFILLGKRAQSLEDLINRKKHRILKTSHPSPLSANQGFLGSGIFLDCNSILIDWSEKPISWLP